MQTAEKSNVRASKEAEFRAMDHEARVLEMSEEHQKACNEIRNILDGQRHERATAWYEVGRKVMRITADLEYGDKAVAKIARALGRDPSLLYDAGRVAETWAPQKFKELMNKRDKVRGNRLSWSHLVELASVSDSGRRGLLVKLVIREGLSVRDLKKEIAGPKPADNQENEQASNVAKALRNFKATCEATTEKAAHWNVLIFDVLDVQDEELGTPNMLQLLQDARKTQLQVKQTCEEHLARLGACIERSEKLLAAAEDTATTQTERQPRGRSQNLDKPRESNNG